MKYTSEEEGNNETPNPLHHTQDTYINSISTEIQELKTDNKTNKNSSPKPTSKILPRTYAATSATVAEEETAKRGRHPDGSTPVKVPKRVWRPKIRMEYEEPEALLDTSGDLDWLFEEHGKVGIEDRKPLPPRDDVIIYKSDKHGKEFDKNIQWRGCPKEYQTVLRDIIENISTCSRKKVCRITYEDSSLISTQVKSNPSAVSNHNTDHTRAGSL